MQLHTVTSICLLLGSEGIIAKHLYIQNNPNLPDDDIQGLAAQRFLLNGAKMMHYLSPRVIIYRRPGGLTTALADFYALKPTNVQKWNIIGGTEIKAKVGQHHLALQTSKFKYPYISITRFEPGKDPEYNFYIKVFAYLGDE